MKKKYLVLLLVFLMLVGLCSVAFADSEIADPSIRQVGINLVITTAVQVTGALLITLIGVLGTWLTLKIGKNEQLKNINGAQKEVIRLAKITVGELQQTVVEKLKAQAVDGKLTKQEIAQLGQSLLDLTKKKMSAPTYDLLEAARVDVEALIVGAAEDLILKNNSPAIEFEQVPLEPAAE